MYVPMFLFFFLLSGVVTLPIPSLPIPSQWRGLCCSWPAKRVNRVNHLSTKVFELLGNSRQNLPPQLNDSVV